MRESIGGAFLIYLTIFLVSTVMLLFVSILSYSKAYRIKNKIISIVESRESFDKDTEIEIMNYLKQSGYMTDPNYNCIDKKITEDTYKYCVVEKCYKSNCEDGKYYNITTYSRIEFPIIGDIFSFAIKGETKVLGRNI